MFSNPDVDYPCSRAFFESDDQYERRSNLMRDLKTKYHGIYQTYLDLCSIVEEEQRCVKAMQRFLDMTYGFIQDDEFKSVLNSKNKLEGRLEQHINRKLKIFDEMKRITKQLSELAR